jgi:hypothetical protein
MPITCPENSGLLDYIDPSLRTGEAIHNRYYNSIFQRKIVDFFWFVLAVATNGKYGNDIEKTFFVYSW